MSNFARLLLVCPFLAVATTIIRCKNQLYEDAAFVLYHLMLVRLLFYVFANLKMM